MQVLIVTIVTAMLTMNIITPYQRANEVKAIVGVDDIAIGLIMALMAAGGSYYLYENFKQWEGPAELYPDYKKTQDMLDEWEKNAYIKWCYEHGYCDENGNPLPDGPNNDDDPDNDLPDNWNDFKDYLSNHRNQLALGGTIIGAVIGGMSDMLSKEKEIGKFAPNGLLNSIPQEVIDGGYECCSIWKNTGLIPSYHIIFSKYAWYCADPSRPALRIEDYIDYDQFTGTKTQSKKAFNYSGGSSESIVVSNGKRYETYDEFYKNCFSDYDFINTPYPGLFNPDSVLSSSDLHNWDADKGSFPLPDSVKIPTLDDILNTWNGYDNADTDDDRQKEIDDFINDLRNPDPTPDPDPNPNPDPDPTPNPDPTPDPDDIPDSEKGNFLLSDGIKDKFPFCVPFDIIKAFTVLKSSSREAPKLELPLKSEKYNINYEISIDLSVYDEQAKLLRTLEIILFIVGLAFVTRGLIKG